ncbi:MAG: hypothetical protein HKO01_02720 [Flaviramulus sp.]|nr:hypothetical protein [Flaviramulus sp.]NNC49430.1 hypothetical protein [Flaviramulus sp.]
MKYLFILLSFIFIDNGCSNSNINQESLSVEYSALSKGIYKQIKISKKSISVTNARGTTPITQTCSEASWETIIKAVKPINVENIPNLKAPTEKRFYDGAAIAHLTINYDGKSYKTEPFDHGYPPKEIEGLVKEILSISENIE